MSDTYGIIYAEEGKSIRRIVVSDDPNYDYELHVHEGEALLLGDGTKGRDLRAARRAMREALAIEPPEPLVAVVDASNLVTAMIMADPALDAVEGHTLIPAYAGVAIGQTYDQPTDTFWVPETTIPAGEGPGGPYDEQTIPAHPVPKPE
jgi:hypothetical protein